MGARTIRNASGDQKPPAAVVLEGPSSVASWNALHRHRLIGDRSGAKQCPFAQSAFFVRLDPPSDPADDEVAIAGTTILWVNFLELLCPQFRIAKGDDSRLLAGKDGMLNCG
tara:strand:- start:13816 stop:14151 length:336 start_codon:yes stop_codon:yes gene_type:complete